MSKAIGSAVLLRETLLTVEKIGNERTVALLRKMRGCDGDSGEITPEYIISAVCTTYSISKKHLYEDKHGEFRFDALCMCAYLLKTVLDFGHVNIAKELKRKSYRAVGRYFARLNKLDENHPQDKQFINKRDSLIREIETYKKTLA